jgi:hypothetical protein
MKTAAEWLYGYLKMNNHIPSTRFNEKGLEKAKEMESNIATEYAEFCVRCDRAGLRLIVFEDWKKELTFKSE